jgi:hypothetical protein
MDTAKSNPVPITILTGFLGAGKVWFSLCVLPVISKLLDHFTQLHSDKRAWEENSGDSKRVWRRY